MDETSVCQEHMTGVHVVYPRGIGCPLCGALDEIARQVAADARGATPIVWQPHRDAPGACSYEEPDLLLTIVRVEIPGDPDKLCRYRASVWMQSPAKHWSERGTDDPIFRVTTESSEMARHALQTWLDRHGPAWGTGK